MNTIHTLNFNYDFISHCNSMRIDTIHNEFDQDIDFNNVYQNFIDSRPHQQNLYTESKWAELVSQASILTSQISKDFNKSFTLQNLINTNNFLFDMNFMKSLR